MTFNAFDVPFPVIPLEMLVNLGQQGTRLQEVELTNNLYTLDDILTDASIMERYAILLLGANTTTGFGKTQCALRMGIEWCVAMNRALNLPREDAQILLSNTVDVGKNIVWKPGMVWILDEFSPSDGAQLVHCSENMLKILFTCNLKGTIRGRNSDVVLSHSVARIITGNASSPTEWVGKTVSWSAPLRRKSVAFQIRAPLCSAAWRVQTPVSSADSASAASTASAIMLARVRTHHAAPQLPVVASSRSSGCDVL
jgi:hypothetical protein